MARDLPSGTVTFLFTDIEGSTRLLQALPDRYGEMLEEHRRLIRRAIAAHGGTEIGTEGDSFFAVFASAIAAVAASAQAQRELARVGWPGGPGLRVRMGLHTGEGRLSGRDYVGIDVHRGARIAAAAHGGEVLVSDATRALVASSLPDGLTLRDLGEHRLKDLDAHERLYRLVIDGLSSEFPPPRSEAIGRAHVPPRATSFVGRRHDLEALQQLVRDNRLVTLIGPGGTGKTRLAIELAVEAADDFVDGAWFVDLAPLTDPGLVGPTIARALGLSDQTGRPLIDLLKAYIEPRAMLLVLDNFEHLPDAAPVVADLLATAPSVKILVTSRSVMNLYGEQEFPVAPLALPGATDPMAVDQVARFEAVALFVERARAVKPTFTITPANGLSIVGVCVRVDGLPLAIELAASRVRLLEPAEILARLERHVPVLATGASNVPIRQQTLRATIDWSYDLLEPRERALFERLSIFSGGCSLEAAEAICNPASELTFDTLDGLGSLVDHSLIRRTGDGAESRFTMLETIREYGRDRLVAGDDLDAIGRRHLHYYRSLAELAEPNLVGRDQVKWLDQLEGEHDNLRDALRRARELSETEGGLGLGAALWRFWFQRGYLREGRAWLEDLLAQDGAAMSRSRAKAWGALGGLAYWLSDVAATEGAYNAAVRLYREMGDRAEEAEALLNLGFVPLMRRDVETARQRFEESLALAQGIGRDDLVARSKQAMAMTDIDSDPQRAVSLLEESLALFRATGDQFDIGGSLTGLARARSRLGQHELGRRAYLEALGIFTEAQNLPSIGIVMGGMAGLESSAGRHVEALRLVGAAAALRERTNASGPLIPVVERDVLDSGLRAIGDEEGEAVLAAGRLMTTDQAIDYVTALAREAVT